MKQWKSNFWILAGCATLVAGLSMGLMGCPEDDDDDDVFRNAQIRVMVEQHPV